MSLLMQALKRAESAKQKQGDAAGEAPPKAEPARTMIETEALSLQPQEPSRHVTAPAEGEAPTGFSGHSRAPAATASTPVDYFSADPRPSEPHYAVADGPQNSFDSELGFPAKPANEVRAPVADPVSGMAPAPATEPPPPASAAAGTQPKLKIGIDEQQAAALAAKKALEARNSAKSVFAAKQMARNRRPFIIAGIGIIVLSIAGAIGYFQLMGLTQPPVLMAMPPTGIAPEADPAAAIVLPDEAIADVAAAVPLPESTMPVPPVTPSAMPNPEPVRQPAPPAQPRPLADSGSAPSDTIPSSARAPLAAQPPLATMAAQSQAIQIRRSSASQQVNPTLISAYQAFLAGDVDTAQAQYRRLLQQEPDNRDALLGMAAIAVNRGQHAQAGSFYARLLELDPADAEAGAGLASVQRGDVNQIESNLKQVLAKNPQTGSALFALGNVYAQQSRWPEAQQAYFRAFGMTPGSADYAFNLAVSLDKLTQSKLALDYYQQSLQLARQGGGNLDREAVLNRIRELQLAIAMPDPD